MSWPVRDSQVYRKMLSEGKSPGKLVPDACTRTVADMRFRKLVIIGDGACGKTSLLSVFTLGYFPRVQSSMPLDLTGRIMYMLIQDRG